MSISASKETWGGVLRAVVDDLNERRGEEIFKYNPSWWVRPLRVAYVNGHAYIQEAIYMPALAHTWDGNWKLIPAKAETLKIESFTLTEPE
jgi:hypothetical protein